MTRESRNVTSGWSTVLIAAAAHFFLFADRALPSALAPALRVRFGLSDTALGALIGTFMIVPYAIGTLFAGHFLGRSSPYRVMAFSILAWTIAAAAGALAQNHGELFAARVAFGLGQAAFAPTALSLLSTVVRPSSAVATSAFSTGSASGRSGGLLLGGLLMLLAGAITLPGGPAEGIAPWRLASLGLLVPNVILAVALILRNGPESAIASPAVASGLGEAFRRMAQAPRAFAGHFTAAAGAVVIAQASGAWAPSLINRRLGFDTAHSAIIVGLIVLVAAPLGHLSAGRFAARKGFDRRGPQAGMTGGAIGALICCIVLVALPGPVATIVAIAGLTATAGFTAAMSLIGLPPIVEGGNRVAAMSLFFASTTLVGYGVGPLITGMLSDHFGTDADRLGLALALVVAVSAAVICMAGFWGAAAWRDVAGGVRRGLGE